MSFKIFSISNSHSQREEAIFSKDIRKIIVCQGRFIHISHSQPCMGFGKSNSEILVLETVMILTCNRLMDTES